jgi:hypothetical protein
MGYGGVTEYRGRVLIDEFEGRVTIYDEQGRVVTVLPGARLGEDDRVQIYLQVRVKEEDHALS